MQLVSLLVNVSLVPSCSFNDLSYQLSLSCPHSICPSVPLLALSLSQECARWHLSIWCVLFCYTHSIQSKEPDVSVVGGDTVTLSYAYSTAMAVSLPIGTAMIPTRRWFSGAERREEKHNP